MLTPSRALAQAASTNPLPTVFPALERADINLMRGEASMIAGQPNSGKTMFALALSRAYAAAGERVLYFSADSNESTVTTRLAAALTGHRAADVRNALYSGGLAYYQDVLSDLDIRFDFNSNPTLDDIDLTMAAYEELLGAYPTVMIWDNLMNIEGVSEGGDSEKHGLIQIQKVAKYICRKTNVALLVLHHCSEAEGKPHLPPPRKMIQQKVNELPEVQLTVAYNPDTSEFGVAAVKNRHGRADPAAKAPVWLYADMDSGRFFDSRYDAIIGGVAV